MNNINPPTKSIDIKTQEGLDLLKIKAEYYGYYAEHLKVLELIMEIEKLREDMSWEHEKDFYAAIGPIQESEDGKN